METPKKPTPPSDDVDIMRYLSLFASNWIWIVASLFIAICLAYAFNHYSPRVYNVKSSLLIDEEKNAGSVANLEKLMPSGDYYGSWRNLENEVIILQSYALNYRVMEEMPDFHTAYIPINKHGIQGQRMYKTSPFALSKLEDKQPYGVQMTIRFRGPDSYTVEVDENYIKALKKKGYDPKMIIFPAEKDKVYKLGEPYTFYGFNFNIEKRDSFSSLIKEGSRYLVWFESPEALANQYRSNLTVKPAKEGASVFILTYNGYSPDQGCDYLNKLMELYGTQELEWKNRSAENTILFIEQQLGLISDSLNKAENSMEKFRLNNRFVDLTMEGSLILQKLEKSENEKNDLGLQLQYYQYLLQYIDSKEDKGSIVSPSVMGVSDAVLIRLVEEFSALQQKKKQVAYAMKSEVPQTEAVDKQLETARAALRENVANSISQLNIAKKNLSDRIAKVELDMDKLPGTERQLIGIQRKFDLNNTVYNFLLERRAEAGIARASQLSDNRIIDVAVPRNSAIVSPTTMKNYLVAFVLGLLVPILFILFIDLFNNKIIGRHDIEAISKAPILGFISHSNYTAEIPVVDKPGSTLAESFRSIRTSLGFYTGQTSCPVIAVSSPISGEGKTFISVNLAAIIAMMNKKVLIIGLDLRKPRAHMVLSLENPHGEGMSSYLSFNANFEDVIVPTDVKNLWFAPAGTPPPNPAELIGSPRMGEFITRARTEFDTIIIDTPPVGIVTDAMLLSSYVNVNIFVVRQRYTTKGSVAMLDEIYRKGEMANVAYVINDISASGYYGYGLRYGFTLGYGQRYYDPGNYQINNRDKGRGYYTND
jgi:tyrosine-protein kinase Etk/Wzc